MPFLENTEIQKAISKTTGRFAEPEFREGKYTSANLLLRNEASVYQNLDSLKQSVKQPTEAILMSRRDDAIGTNKEADHAGNFEDSFVQPINYLVATRKFKVSYKLAENNQFGYQEQLETGFRNAFRNLRETLNTYALLQLEALRNQNGNANPVDLTWDAPNFRYTNAAGPANVERQASRIKAAMRKNFYDLEQDMVGGQKLVSDMVHNAAQGTANNVNLSYQFNGINLAEETEIDEGTLGFANGYGYVMPARTVAMTSWNENINRSGRGDVNANEGLFSTISDPILPVTYDLHVMRHLRDNPVATTPAYTHYQDPNDEYEVTAFYSFAHALLSTANESPIFAFGQL